MSARGVADVVFCLDRSGSMLPCLEAVKAHIADFVRGLGADGQRQWDLRFDFVAHYAAGNGRGGAVVGMSSAFNECVIDQLYLGQQGRIFTNDAAEFAQAIGRIEVIGDEAPLFALDTCLDFPWRDAATCHRVVVMLTDEPLEDGLCVKEQMERMPDVIQKIRDLRVMLFLVGPESAAFDQLATVERSEYEVCGKVGDGLATVDFSRVLAGIGKSVSASRMQSGQRAGVPRGLFGQASWGAANLPANARQQR
ncbi:MAG TPA: VWA domain-containing protein [Acidobacteriota bacterium]|nr:VWA domain-containing protein [Acidobacteriota bacterium]